MDPRLVQLGRILNLSLDSASAARVAVAARPEELADALVLEATASDDVISEDSALEYLESRLDYLADAVPDEAAARIRERFRDRVRSW